MDAQAAFKERQLLGALVAALFVDFGADDDEIAADVAEIFDELQVAFLGGNVGVDEADAEFELFAIGEIGIDEVGPAGGNGFGDFGVAVAWEVGEDDFIAAGLAFFGESEEIDGAGAAGGGGDFGGFFTDEGVEQAGFADVGAAEEGDLRGGGGRVTGRRPWRTAGIVSGSAS